MASNWGVEQLEGLVDDILDRRGVTPLKLGSEFTAAGHRVISAKLVKNGRIDLTADEPRFVDSATYQKWMRTPLLPDDVLLTSEAPLGEVSHVNETLEWCLGQRLFCIRTDKKRLDGRFLYYALQSNSVRNDLASRSTGTTVQGIRQSELRKVLIPLPPLVEQKAIAHILAVLDDKIDLNRRTNETLEAMAQSLFKDWFVDFGPVRAKLEGLEPYLTPELWSLFPDTFDADGKPSGWDSITFGDLLSDSIGGDWGKEAPDTEHSQPVCIIRGTDFQEVAAGGIGKVPTRYVAPRKLAARLLTDGDVVVEVSGGSPTQPTGRSLAITTSILERFPHPVICASFCRRFRPLTLQHSSLAAQHLSHLYANGGTWEYQNQSTGIANFQTKHFLESERAIWPGEAIVVAFFNFIDPLVRRVTANEIQTLTVLRDSLLPKLLSGDLRVRDAERLVAQPTA